GGAGGIITGLEAAAAPGAKVRPVRARTSQSAGPTQAVGTAAAIPRPVAPLGPLDAGATGTAMPVGRGAAVSCEAAAAAIAAAVAARTVARATESAAAAGPSLSAAA